MPNTFLYFAYGSNLLTKRLHVNNPSAIRAGMGKLNHFRLDFQRFSERWHGCSATIVPHNGYCVWGALWEINLDHLQTLDKQEGVDTNIYFRYEVDVEVEPGTTRKCQVYQQVQVPNEFIKLSELPEHRQPSSTYLKTIVRGAKESELPQEYQELLQNVCHNGFDNDVNLSLELD